MPISHSDQLFALIKSLSKAEKKSFTVYARRLLSADTIKYLQLFDLMDKADVLNDELIIKKLGRISKVNYSNLKRHLYKQILTSLRLVQIQKNAEIEVREYIDFADILYDKGLVLQSLKILDKAMSAAKKCRNELLELDIIEKIKTIESRNITRSGTGFVEGLTQEAMELGQTVHRTVVLSNMSLTLHAYYIQHGHIKNEKDRLELQPLYKRLTEVLGSGDFSYQENVYYLQCMVWYHYIMLDFQACFEAASQWINLMKANPLLIEQDPDLYMRAYHYLLTSAYYLNAKKDYVRFHQELTKFREKNYGKFKINTQINSFLYVHLSRFNLHFLHKSYDGAIEVIPNTLRRIHRYRDKLDEHRIMVFYFKIAFTYLMTKQPGKALDYLVKIMVMEVGNLREDIQGYARLMLLMAHYDYGNTDQLDYLVKKTRVYFNQMKETSRIQYLTLDYFQQLCKAPVLQRQHITKDFKKELENIKQDPYEKRAFYYLDISSWLEKSGI